MERGGTKVDDKRLAMKLKEYSREDKGCLPLCLKYVSQC